MLKKFLLVPALISCTLIVNAQAPTVKGLNINEDENKIYTSVQQQPEYPGGFQALQQYIKTKVRYPDSASVTNVQLTAAVRFIMADVHFIVERGGSLTDVKAAQGISASLDAEAVRLARNMPKWQPGIQDNRPVRTLYNLSIYFSLKEHSADLSGYGFVNNNVTLVKPTTISGPKLTDNDPSQGEILNAVEQQPEFPGGLTAFYQYLSQSIQYPVSARKNNKQGQVIITMVIEKNGSVNNVQVLLGVSPDIDAEAVRVISASPKWKPGMQNGKPVRVRYSVPISFTLGK